MPFTSAGYMLFEVLRKLRADSERSSAALHIFNDKTLVEMCVKPPLNEEAMQGGCGENE